MILLLSFPSEINETVICTNDHMEVVIPSVFFLNKVPPVYVSHVFFPKVPRESRVAKRNVKRLALCAIGK